MYSLAACAEMLFLDQPIQERARRLHDLGFGVEIWDWTRHDLAALERSGALADVGYDGTVAMEAWAADDSDLALERVRSAFTPLTVSTAPHGGSS